MSYRITESSRETAEAYILGGIGAAKGLYEVYKPTDNIERIETAGLLLGLGGLAVGIVYGVKELLK